MALFYVMTKNDKKQPKYITGGGEWLRQIYHTVIKNDRC